MKSVTLANGATTSRLGFGASRLHYLRTSVERQKMLAAALDFGLTHIDVAPIYGEGLAEREVGRARKGGKSFTLTTKFGISPLRLIDAVPALALPVMAARSVLRRFDRAQEARPVIDATLLRASLEASLRRLQTEYVDLLLLHEPTLNRIADTDALVDELDRLRTAGKIGSWGLAGGWDAACDIAARFPALAQVIQTGESEWSDEALRKPDIVFGAISAGPQKFVGPHLNADAAKQRLATAMRRRPGGLTLVSTSRIENLKIIAEFESTI